MGIITGVAGSYGSITAGRYIFLCPIIEGLMLSNMKFVKQEVNLQKGLATALSNRRAVHRKNNSYVVWCFANS